MIPLNSSTRFFCRLTAGMLASFASVAGTAMAAPLTLAQVAQHAHTAGFRGGALSTAIAIADAESGREPLAVSNNYYLTNANGDVLPDANGHPRVRAYANTIGTILPVDGSVQVLSIVPFERGKVVNHCRGLWQLNDAYVSTVLFPDAVCLTPQGAADGAFCASNQGKKFWKWVTMSNGTALQTARITAARDAALVLDATAIPNNPVNLRVRARWENDNVRATPAGAFLRDTIAGDTGVVTGAGVDAIQYSNRNKAHHIYYPVAWDNGVSGWIAEEYIQTTTAPAVTTPPLPTAYSLPPAATDVLTKPLLAWTPAPNSGTFDMYLGTTPQLNQPGDKKISNLLVSQLTPKLNYNTTYYWRVDSRFANGQITVGPVLSFTTVPWARSPINFTSLFVNTGVPGPTVPANGLVDVYFEMHSDSYQDVILEARWMGVQAESHRVVVCTKKEASVYASLQFHVGDYAGAYGRGPVKIMAWRDVNFNGLVDAADEELWPQGNTPAHATSTEILQRPDPTPPLLTGVQLSTSTVQQGTSVTLNGFAGDAHSGVEIIVVTMVRPGQFFQEHVATQVINPPAAGRPLPFSVVVPINECGIHKLNVQATDQWGNTSEIHQLEVASQLPGPGPQIQMPTSDGSIGSWTNLNLFVNSAERITLDYTVDNGPWINVTTNFFAGFFSVPLSLTEGPHLLTFRAVDACGRITYRQLTLHQEGQTSQTDTFDEKLDFSFFGYSLPHWTATNSSQLILTGITNNGGAATGVHRTKPVPSWAASVEVTFRPTGRAGLVWSRDGGLPNVVVRVVDNQIKAGLDSTAFAPIPAATQIIRLLLEPGGIHVIYLQPFWSEAQPTGRYFPVPGLTLSTLNTLQFYAGDGDFSFSQLENIRIRGVANGFQFAPPRITISPVNSSSVILVWNAVPQRYYRVQSSSDMQTWTSHGMFPQGDSILGQAQPFAPEGPRAYFRVVELE